MAKKKTAVERPRAATKKQAGPKLPGWASVVDAAAMYWVYWRSGLKSLVVGADLLTRAAFYDERAQRICLQAVDKNGRGLGPGEPIFEVEEAVTE